jgi:hypothetical protein
MVLDVFLKDIIVLREDFKDGNMHQIDLLIVEGIVFVLLYYARIAP